MSNPAYSASESDASECAENSFCIFLHLVEGIGLNRRDGIGEFTERHKDKVILTASLNGVKFEVEGHSTETVTIFNNNCIWECELGDIKRMKTDNRPVKIEICLKSGRAESTPRRSIGSLLLPIRGVQIVATLKNVQLKLHWHKLNVLCSEWRQSKPEIYLLLTIVKKNLIDNGQFEAFLGRKKCMLNDGLSPNTSETTLMLQSQCNVYVQLLEQVGLIQVGNNPDVDCDIFNVTLTFKQVKNLMKVLEQDRNYNRSNVFIFHYDFLGSASQLEMLVNPNDCYTINEKISLSFKSSLRSLRTYFQRIFYIPITVYLNGMAIANYRLDFSKLLPEDTYFNTHRNWSKLGTFQFERISKALSPVAPKPSVDFIFCVQLINSYSKKNHCEIMPYGDTFGPYKVDERSSGEIADCYRQMDYPMTKMHKRAPYDSGSVSNRNYNNYEIYERNYMKMQADAALIGRVLEQNSDLLAKSSEDLIKENNSSNEKNAGSKNSTLTQRLSKPTINIAGDLEKSSNSVIENSVHLSVQSFQSHSFEKKVTHSSVGVNTEVREPETDELTLKIVQELEEWKAQQMDHFIQGLAEKEEAYLADLDQQWEQQRAILQAKLEAKITECENLNSKLEKAYYELNANAIKHQETINIVQTVKQDIELSYAKKFMQLDEEMQRLKDEMQHRSNENDEQREIDPQNAQKIENAKLEQQEQEKSEMKMRIEQLEKQLSAVEKTHFSTEQLQGMLDDLRKQTERFADLEKAKNFYKEQWTKSTRELHKLQINMLHKEEEAFKTKKADDEEFCLEEILEEENEALISDRSELKYIKTLLYDSSESASIDELMGE